MLTEFRRKTEIPFPFCRIYFGGKCSQWGSYSHGSHNFLGDFLSCPSNWTGPKNCISWTTSTNCYGSILSERETSSLTFLFNNIGFVLSNWDLDLKLLNCANYVLRISKKTIHIEVNGASKQIISSEVHYVPKQVQTHTKEEKESGKINATRQRKFLTFNFRLWIAV